MKQPTGQKQEKTLNIHLKMTISEIVYELAEITSDLKKKSGRRVTTKLRENCRLGFIESIHEG
jgi:hypothetical protein